MRIFISKWFDRFMRKNDIDSLMLIDAINRAESGLIDADLGRGVIKQRIAREGQGRSKGYRTIVILRQAERAFLFMVLQKIIEIIYARMNKSLSKTCLSICCRSQMKYSNSC